MSGKFYVIEGLDGVGKSTTTSNVAKALGYKNLEWIIEPFEKIKDFIKHGNVSDDVKFLMSVASMKHTSEEVSKIISNGSGVVMSRYAPSMLSYYKAQCEYKNVSPIMVDPYSVGYTKPDKVIYLDLPEPERLKRINERGASDKGEDYLSQNHTYRLNLISQLKSSASDIVNISGLTQARVLAKVLDIIHQPK